MALGAATIAIICAVHLEVNAEPIVAATLSRPGRRTFVVARAQEAFAEFDVNMERGDPARR